MPKEDSIYKTNIGLGNRVLALNAQEELLGYDHPDVLFALQKLAGVHYRRGEYDHANRILEERESRRSGKIGKSIIPSEISF